MFSEKLYAFGEASFVLRQKFKRTCKLYTKGIAFFVIKICSVFNIDSITVLFCTMQIVSEIVPSIKLKCAVRAAHTPGGQGCVYFPRNAGQEDDHSSCSS